MSLALCMKRVLAPTVLVVMVCFSLPAQTGTATLSGVVEDPKGALVPDVEVMVTRIETGAVATTKTNGAGIYVLTALMPGHYHLLIRKPGFKEIAIKTFELHVQDKLEQNFSLEIGSVSETVTVSANAEHMPTDDAAVGLLVNRTFIENTPLNGRSFQDLIALAPGAVTANEGSGLGLFSINGQYEDANYFTVDGVAANLNAAVNDSRGTAGVLPSQTALGTTQALNSLDSLQEFKIQTSGYTAEYGRQPGGQISLTTRSGTNDVHGSLFDYFRNSVMDANDWFANQAGIPRQADRQNDFGGTVGGPLVIPKLYDGKNKTFYFVSYEGLRLTAPQFSGIRQVPTLAFRQFAAPGIQPFLNAFPIPNGQNVNDFCLASLGPAYSNLSCSANWSAGFSSRSSLDAMSFRVDQIIGQRLQLFLRYADTPSELSSLALPAGTQTISGSTHSWTLGSTLKLTANLLDEFRFNYTVSDQFFNERPIAFAGAVPYPRSLLVPPQYAPGATAVQGEEFLLFPNETFDATPYQNYSSKIHQYNVIDSLSWIHGAHAIKFGADFRRLPSFVNRDQYLNELVILSPSSVQQGLADEAVVGAFLPYNPTLNNLSLYVQDHWKLLPRLTLDLGLRWEFNPAPGPANGLAPLALTTSNLVTAQLAPRGTPQYHTSYDNFGPRIGFAYNVLPSQSHSSVIRGGFGIFYDTGQALGTASFTGYPFSATSVLTNVSLPASIAPPSLNVPLVPPYGFLLISDPNLKLPYTEQWNLSVDQGLSSKNTLTVSYVGNVGRRLLYSSIRDLSTVNPAFTSLIFLNNAASSNYNALQVQDQGYVAPGLQLITSYTWGHAIDNASQDDGVASQFATPRRGNSDSDVRSAFNLALNYQIPGAASTRLLRVLTQGWSTDFRLTAFTGYPLNIYQGVYFLPDGTQSFIRPDLVAGKPVVLRNVPGVLGGWELNSAAFSPVALNPDGSPVQQGNLGRNIIHGPGFWNLTTALQRSFTLHEPLRLIFRAEAFNIFNHPNAGNIDSCLCDALFGQSNPNSAANGFGVPTVGVPNQLYATGAARSLQIMLKLQF